jgi:hypothetical protein
MEKKYKLEASAIKRMVPEMGFGFVTDKIAVEGRKVDYMARQEPEREEDSGWIFYGGGETQEYMDDANNISLLEINTIANYDPEIIPFLTYPPGTEIGRNAAGKLEVITKGVEKPEVILLGPIEGGRVILAKTWRFEVSSLMLRRMDHGSLVIWQPGFTIWINVYKAKGKSIQERVDGILKIKSKDAFGLQQEQQGGMLKLRYQLAEESNGEIQDSVCLFGFTADEEVHMAIYYDEKKLLDEVNKIWQSLSSVADELKEGEI